VEEVEEEEYNLAMWPVHDRNTEECKQLAKTHNVKPIPAFGMSNKHIPPREYESHLCGAVVLVHFGLIHHYIRPKKKSVFVAALREMHILRLPINVLKSPLKKRRLMTKGSSHNASRDD
jgi:hypothetical protein